MASAEGLLKERKISSGQKKPIQALCGQTTKKGRGDKERKTANRQGKKSVFKKGNLEMSRTEGGQTMSPIYGQKWEGGK